MVCCRWLMKRHRKGPLQLLFGALLSFKNNLKWENAALVILEEICLMLRQFVSKNLSIQERIFWNNYHQCLMWVHWNDILSTEWLFILETADDMFLFLCKKSMFMKVPNEIHSFRMQSVRWLDILEFLLILLVFVKLFGVISFKVIYHLPKLQGIPTRTLILERLL